MSDRRRNDQVYNDLRSTSSLKIPIYDVLASAGDVPGNIGNVIVESSTGTFYGHDGTTWVPLGGGGGGEANTGANVGVGVDTAGVFRDKTGVTLNFRSLQSTDNSVTITETADNINLQTTGGGGGEINTASNIGGFAEWFSSKVGTDLQFRTAQSSDNSLTITQNASDIDIVVPADTITELFIQNIPEELYIHIDSVNGSDANVPVEGAPGIWDTGTGASAVQTFRRAMDIAKNYCWNELCQIIIDGEATVGGANDVPITDVVVSPGPPVSPPGSIQYYDMPDGSPGAARSALVIRGALLAKESGLEVVSVNYPIASAAFPPGDDANKNLEQVVVQLNGATTAARGDHLRFVSTSAPAKYSPGTKFMIYDVNTTVFASDTITLIGIGYELDGGPGGDDAVPQVTDVYDIFGPDNNSLVCPGFAILSGSNIAITELVLDCRLNMNFIGFSLLNICCAQMNMSNPTFAPSSAAYSFSNSFVLCGNRLSYQGLEIAGINLTGGALIQNNNTNNDGEIQMDNTRFDGIMAVVGEPLQFRISEASSFSLTSLLVDLVSDNSGTFQSSVIDIDTNSSSRINYCKIVFNSAAFPNPFRRVIEVRENSSLDFTRVEENGSGSVEINGGLQVDGCIMGEGESVISVSNNCTFTCDVPFYSSLANPVTYVGGGQPVSVGRAFTFASMRFLNRVTDGVTTIATSNILVRDDPFADCDYATVAGIDDNIDLASAPATIDGVAPGINDRILVKDGSAVNNGTTSIDNGIYIYAGAGNPMARAADFPAGAVSFSEEQKVYILSGTDLSGTSWELASNVTNVGVDNIEWRSAETRVCEIGNDIIPFFDSSTAVPTQNAVPNQATPDYSRADINGA